MNKEDIKTLRRSMKLTQHQFSVKLGVSPDTVKSWEQGRRKPQNIAIKVMKSWGDFK